MEEDPPFGDSGAVGLAPATAPGLAPNPGKDPGPAGALPGAFGSDGGNNPGPDDATPGRAGDPTPAGGVLGPPDEDATPGRAGAPTPAGGVLGPPDEEATPGRARVTPPAAPPLAGGFSPDSEPDDGIDGSPEPGVSPPAWAAGGVWIEGLLAGGADAPADDSLAGVLFAATCVCSLLPQPPIPRLNAAAPRHSNGNLPRRNFMGSPTL